MDRTPNSSPADSVFPPPEPEAGRTLLVVDDEAAIRSLLADSLGRHGYRVETAANPHEMDAVLARVPVERRIARRNGPPIILLSALGEEADRILGLEIGASHYLPKPCSPREILATVRAALRQTDIAQAPERRAFTFAGWRIDFVTRELFDPKGVLIDLTDGEFAVLRAFVERSRRVLTREALLDAARGRDNEAYDRAIDVQVSRLRRKLQAPDDEIIRTVRNEGYLFVPRVIRV